MERRHDGFWIALTVLTILAGCILFDLYQSPGNSYREVIGVNCMTLNNPFYEVIENELKKSTSAQGDFLSISDPMMDPKRQSDQLMKLVEENVDGIILNPVDSATLSKALWAASDKRIPVIVIDSPIHAQGPVSTTIVSDNQEAGALCARDMMASMESAEILLLEHTSADSARERIEGFLKEIEPHPSYHIAAREECQGQLELAMPATAAALAEHPEINVIMALNDPSALGASAAAESMGRTDLSIYGVDGTPDFKKQMENNPLLKATVAQSPYTIARLAAGSYYDLKAGKSVPSVQIVPVTLITRQNLNDFTLEGWQ